MSWDLRLDYNRDLTYGIVTGIEEIIQRLLTRLNRELGEWFLNTSVGLPMYQNGEGLLGSKDKTTLDLLVRRETLQTTGISRILKMNTIYKLGSREYSIYFELVTTYGAVNVSITNGEVSWLNTV